MRWRPHLIADRAVVLGALGLVISLFLTWSHQIPGALLRQPGARIAFEGVPRDPTGWQVYSTADVLLALLAGGFVLAVLLDRRRARVIALIAVALALAFVAHGVAVPPTNGALIAGPEGSHLPNTASAGAGEVVAIASLALASLGLLAGLALS
jgi:hypothetical protein